MSDHDRKYVEQALELARKGAGLVSPNPMVGALLVKDGQVVGEGYHRYDGLKHAESIAIERAGENARGATLYCSLEPCRHYGRTPPCTTSLIAAGIARAVVPVKDPNPLVNGGGINDLRAAGIEVDVGLCHREALKLNECYFRFISTHRPFVHGILEYSNSSSAELWTPSSSFLQASSDYDAIMLGSRLELNLLLASARISRERHRSVVVLGSRQMLATLQTSLDRHAIEDLSEILIAPSGLSSLEVEEGAIAKSEDSESPIVTSIFSAESDFESILDALGRLDVTSVIALPGLFDAGVQRQFELLDRLTLAVSGVENADVNMSRLTFGEVEFDLEEVTVSRTEGYTEFSGYPHLRGVA